MSCDAVVDVEWLKTKLDSGANVIALDVSNGKDKDMHAEFSRYRIPKESYKSYILWLFPGFRGFSHALRSIMEHFNLKSPIAGVDKLDESSISMPSSNR